MYQYINTKDQAFSNGDNRKMEVKLSLCLTKHYAMKTYGEVDVYVHFFLSSALVGGEWSASHPCRFTPEEGTG
jgi:hypothetical protein